jgi:hypothetical protein
MTISKQEATRQADGRDAQQLIEFISRADTVILELFGTDDPVLVPIGDTPPHIIRLAIAEYQAEAKGWRCILRGGPDGQDRLSFE